MKGKIIKYNTLLHFKKRILFLSLFCLQSTFCFSQSSNFLSKRIDFNPENLTISDALLLLSEEADISIAFNSNLFDPTHKISFDAQKETIHDILTQCLKGTDIGFKTENNRIVLFKKPPKKWRLSGFLQDEETGERLIAANVWDRRSGKGAVTNDYGFFSIELTAGAVDLEFSYIGYQSVNERFDLQKSTRISIDLKPEVVLAEVIVTPDDINEGQRRFLIGKGMGISKKDIQKSPSLAGEPDLFRSLQLQSGVQSGSDGFGGLHVRGGDADQNLVLLDGVPVYSPSHTLGLFSIFNTHTIQSARFLKDGFSAKYSGRLSSVMDIRMKEGNNKNLSGIVDLSTLASKAMLEIPLANEKGGILFSARRTHIDPWIENISRAEKEEDFIEGQSNYHFYDLNAKLHFKPSKDDRIFLSFYNGGDSFKDKNFIEDDFDDFFYEQSWDQKIEWGNTITALRWNHVYGEKLFSNVTATYSQFEYSSENDNRYFEDDNGLEYRDNYYTRFQTILRDAGAKMDFDYFLSEKHHLTFGGNFLWRKFEPGGIEIEGELLDETSGLEETSEIVDEVYEPLSVTALEYGLYMEDQIKVGEKVQVLVGVHGANFRTNSINHFSLQPRLSLEWTPSDRMKNTISTSRMTQFLHVLTSSGSGFPNDMWVPSTEEIPPQDAWQIAGSSHLNWSSGFQVQLEGYYKKLDNLISYQEGAALPSLFENDPFFWEEDITEGEGWAYGFGVQLEQIKGNTTGAISYNWSKSERQFELVNFGEKYPFRFVHEHFVNIQLRHQITKGISAGLLWQYGSGQPITLAITPWDFAPLDNLAPVPSERIGSFNGHKMPAYHRLDLDVQFEWKKEKISHFLTLGVYNLYNRENPYFQYWLEDELFPEDNGLKSQNALPILPTLGYRLQFKR